MGWMRDDAAKRYDTLQWLMFQMSTVRPMLGQTHFCYKYAPDHFDRDGLTIGINRYVGEANRIYNILDRRLGAEEWLASGTYTIADMAVWPCLRAPEFQGVRIEEDPHVQRWRAAIALGLLDDESGIPSLRHALTDPTPKVSESAAEAIEKIERAS